MRSSTPQHRRKTHLCFLVPGPPYFGLSRQLAQVPQSCRVQPSQLPHPEWRFRLSLPRKPAQSSVGATPPATLGVLFGGVAFGEVAFGAAVFEGFLPSGGGGRFGGGSWGGNSIDDNLNWTHFVNRVRIARQIKPVEPTVEEVFADYFAETRL